MKAILKLALKVFLYSGFTFGVLLLFNDYGEGRPDLLIRFIYHSVFLGLIMVAVFVPFQLISLKKQGIVNITDDNVGVRQSRKVLSDYTFDEIKELLKADQKFGNKKTTETGNSISVFNGISWFSWGEEVKIELIGDNKGVHEYLVSSSPVLKITLIDYGKNLDNVNYIERIIVDHDF